MKIVAFVLLILLALSSFIFSGAIWNQYYLMRLQSSVDGVLQAWSFDLKLRSAGARVLANDNSEECTYFVVRVFESSISEAQYKELELRFLTTTIQSNERDGERYVEKKLYFFDTLVIVVVSESQREFGLDPRCL